MPQACASSVRGIQSQPPERAVVPPKCGSFSTIRTLRPRCPTVTAADRPAQPEPTTSASHFVSFVLAACHDCPEFSNGSQLDLETGKESTGTPSCTGLGAGAV